MVEFERVRKGIALYFSREIADVARKCLMQRKYLTQDNLFDVDRVRWELRVKALKNGAVTIRLPIIGDVAFTPDDIDGIYSCIIES